MCLIFAQATPPALVATNAATASHLRISPDLIDRIVTKTGLPAQVVQWGINIVAALIVLLIGYWIANWARNIIRRLCQRRRLDETVTGFMANLLHAVAMVFAVTTALSQIGVPTQNFTAIIATAGFAIAFALQGSLSNFASGFLLIIFRPFKKGDRVNAGGIEGSVEEISIFSTTLTTSDNKRMIVPNSAIMGGTITNHTGNERRRVELRFSVGTADDLAAAHAALKGCVSRDPRALQDPAPSVGNVKLIDDGIQVELRVWCRTSDLGDFESDLIARCPAALAAAGIKGPDKTVKYRELR